MTDKPTTNTSASASTFEPAHPFNLEDPKTWAETIGAMDWDKTHICFTKRSLLEFLKQAGVSVGTNYTELQKLPKYASFGKFSPEAIEEAVNDLVGAEIADPHSGDSDNKDANFRPSRKVTQPPGGRSTINIVSGEYEEEDALSLAPPKPSKAGETGKGEDQQGTPVLTHTERVSFTGVSFGGEEQQTGAGEGFRPTRKVRENPGGNSTLRGNMFSGYGEE